MSSSGGKKVLITGGTGYIGSSLAFRAQAHGYYPILLDNYVTSQKLPQAFNHWPVIEVDLKDFNAVEKALRQIGPVHAILHLAAHSLVSESVAKPEKYLRNNLSAALNIADWAVQNKVQYFVHSSSCAIYGIPKALPIHEGTEPNPVSPYGLSKWLVEKILAPIAEHRKLSVIHLRYFNPAGAMGDGALGEKHLPETHLIPNIIAALKDQSPFQIFGNDYETPDGTCVRDLIHIEDLVEAHWKALSFLETNPSATHTAVNLGGGKGTSVGEAIKAAETLFGKKLKTIIAPRRPADPATLIADTAKAKRLLGWEPKFSLNAMLQSQFNWTEHHGNNH